MSLRASVNWSPVAGPGSMFSAARTIWPCRAWSLAPGVTANVAPAAMHEMCALALGGDFEGASRVDERLRDLHAAMFFESNPIPAKWALQDMGMIQEGIRLPLTPLSEIYHERVRAALHSAERVSA